MSKLYIFFRKGTFYPIELRDDEDARCNAECNPGTLRVEAANGRVVWPVVAQEVRDEREK